MAEWEDGRPKLHEGVNTWIWATSPSKAKDLIGDNADKVDDAIDAAGDFVDDKTDDKYADHVDTAQEKAKDLLGGGDDAGTA